MASKKKSTTKSSVIRTENGSRLRLTPTRLVQIDHHSVNPWYVTKADLKASYQQGDSGVRIYEVRLGGNVRVHFSPSYYQIGCCGFTADVFRQILRQFGIRKSRAMAAKAGA